MRQRAETLVDRFTRTATVDTVVAVGAKRWPDRVAILFEDRSWTYRELDEAVARGARELLRRGLRKGDRVAAYGRNSDAYAIAFLSCARAGLVHVPVNYALSGEELSYLLAQCGAAAVLSDPELRPGLEKLVVPGVDTAMPLFGAADSFLALATSGPVPEAPGEVADTDLAQLLYTSGTTSRPKGAMMTHRALLYEYLSAVEALGCAEHDRPLHPMPLYHSAGMHTFLMPYLMVGATSTILRTPDLDTVLDTLERHGNGAVFLAPTVWIAFAKRGDLAGRDFSGLKKAFYGASVMPAATLSSLRSQLPGAGFYNCFGQSEIGPLATVLRPHEHAKRPQSCGRPVRFVTLRVVDEQGDDVRPGGRGEVVYSSPQLCSGYWGKETETVEAFRNGWFHSGDLAEIDDEGYITIVDRIKDIINSGGVNIAPRHVEDVLHGHEAVQQAAVVGLPDEKWIEAVTAFVVASPPVAEEELRAFVADRLSPQAAPKRYVFVDDLPRNQSGKILKRELRQWDDR
ncbi:MAG: fatty acyl-CoA synthetase [Segniliparus sp.]|uniref:fatty acyl-CoA synthetase n=1 Tax=Segniliparus sp. TaxID=2804064 RepID=UPI003F407E5E